jgi:purine-binding chemotaxis protein CheW
MSAREAATDARQLLSFLVGGVACAAPLAHVREIVRYEPPTRVPRSPRAVRGVVNLRGTVVPVVDLSVACGLAAASVTAQTCLLVVEMAVAGEAAVLGLLVDAVSEVIERGDDELAPVPPFGTPIAASVLLGLVPAREGFAFLLDLDGLVGDGALLAGGAA